MVKLIRATVNHKFYRSLQKVLGDYEFEKENELERDTEMDLSKMAGKKPE